LRILYHNVGRFCTVHGSASLLSGFPIY